MRFATIAKPPPQEQLHALQAIDAASLWPSSFVKFSEYYQTNIASTCSLANPSGHGQLGSSVHINEGIYLPPSRYRYFSLP
jgi:hypothetical protein